jgi:hypothetical protein
MTLQCMPVVLLYGGLIVQPRTPNALPAPAPFLAIFGCPCSGIRELLPGASKSSMARLPSLSAASGGPGLCGNAMCFLSEPASMQMPHGLYQRHAHRDLYTIGEATEERVWAGDLGRNDALRFHQVAGCRSVLQHSMRGWIGCEDDGTSNG